METAKIISSEVKKTNGHAIITTFDQYQSEKNKWFQAHPNAVIVEEFRNTFLMQPEPVRGIQFKQAPVVMIMYAFFYQE